LSGINWSVQSGEHWAIVGPNGSGKTTLTEALAGKGWISEGKLHYGCGEDDGTVFDTKNIGLVSTGELLALTQSPDRYYQQRFNSLDAESAPVVREILLEKPAELSAADRLEHVADILGIRHLLYRSLIKLSNGETKRVLIAKALIRQPSLLILDNPFIGLDSQARDILKSTVNEVARSGTQIILIAVAHELPDAITHVITLQNGQVRGQYSKEEFMRLTEENRPGSKEKPVLLQPTAFPFSAPAAPAFRMAVQMQGVNVSYGDTQILENIYWTVGRGDKWALLGPNGSGKSTLLSLINGDNPQAYANHIVLFDRKRGSGESIWEIKKQIGFVSPELHLYYPSGISCLQVVASGHFEQMGEEYSAFRRTYTEEQTQRVQDYFAWLEIGHLSERSFSTVSTGEQRLVLLARALVKAPPLLILDEPCQGLDEENKERFKSLVDRICRHSDKTLIYVTHYTDEIPDCVDQVLRLEKGRITGHGV
jgi:molybdate transport system ATP-binding protein